MGLIHFQPSRKAGGDIEVRNIAPDAAATFTLGSILARDTDPELIVEHGGGSTVTGILGVAMGGCTAGVPTFGSKVPVAIATVEQEFMGQVWDVSGSAVATAAAGTHEGVSFGVVKINNDWYVDEEDTSNVVVRVTKVMPEINAVLFKFLASAIVS